MNKQRFQWLVYGFLSVFLPGSGVFADNSETAVLSGGEGNARLDYLGDRTRVGVGVDDEGEVSGEVLHVFGEQDDAAYIGEGWFSQAGAGLKLNYHWLSGDKVYKLFGAVDQNEELDRKASLGAGLETENMFAGAYASAAISDARELSSRASSQSQLMTGNDNIGAWQQNQTTTILTRRYAKPYDYGVGLRVGRYMEQGLWRFRLGADYEWGDYNAEQLTYSAGLEKFIAGTGHSVALTLEHSERSGDFDPTSSDNRAMLVWRYSFGDTYRPAVKTRQVERTVSVPGDAGSTTTAYNIVKHEVDMKADAFFDLDSSTLRSEHLGDLRQFAQLLSEQRILGKMSLVGHTCDRGSDAYNLKLSERRAAAVREKLIEYGVPGEQILTEGRGESQPRYPNDGEANRSKNRRVDIHFLKLEENREVVTPKAPSERIEWITESVDQPPAWQKRALVNPVNHKRRVDVYHYETTDTTVNNGDKLYLSRLPIAQDDSLSVRRNGGASLIDVLVNDRDDDGHQLTITNVTQPANGSVENFGDLVSFTPAPGFSGDTEFTYTISDGKDGQATATVRISVVNDPPKVVNDSASTAINQPVSIDVLANDSDANGDRLTISSVGTTANGSVQIRDGKVSYQPNAGFTGTDSFTYTASDAAGATATGTVTVRVLERSNASPTANNDTLVTSYMPEITVNVLFNDNDPDGDALTITRLEKLPPAAIGTYSFSGPNITFRPGPDWDRKLISITYFISDGFGGTDSAELNIIDP